MLKNLIRFIDLSRFFLTFNVFCAQLTRDLFAIAKFLVICTFLEQLLVASVSFLSCSICFVAHVTLSCFWANKLMMMMMMMMMMTMTKPYAKSLTQCCYEWRCLGSRCSERWCRSPQGWRLTQVNNSLLLSCYIHCCFYTCHTQLS